MTLKAYDQNYYAECHFYLLSQLSLLSVIMFSAIMLNVVAPLKSLYNQAYTL